MKTTLETEINLQSDKSSIDISDNTIKDPSSVPVIPFVKKEYKKPIQKQLGNLEIKDRYGVTSVFELAKIFNSSNLVPAQYQGASKFADCVIAVNMAVTLKVDPLMVFQNLYIIKGKPSWSTPFLISLFLSSGEYKNLDYEFIGDPRDDSYGCIASCIHIETNKKITGPRITKKIVKEEGWDKGSCSKWKTMSDLMFRYRAAAFLIRTITPNVTFGFLAKEEAEDIS